MTQPRGVVDVRGDTGPSFNSGGPRLSFDGPIETTLRFRYRSELTKGSHGCIKKAGSGNGASKKDNPKIILDNYAGEARLRVRLVTPDGNNHVHKLVGGKGKDVTAEQFLTLDQCSKIGTTTEFTLQTYVLHVGSKELIAFCDAYANNVAEIAKKYKKDIENVVILCIEALNTKNQLICPPLYSERILHYKSSSGKLNIETLSLVCCSPFGGERLFILCSPVHKDDIEVHFYENNWRQKAEIELVHHQTAIVVTIPKYRMQDLNTQMNVNIQLVRPSDQMVSLNDIVFTYVPNYTDDLRRKKRHMPPSESYVVPSHNLRPEQSNTVSQSGSLLLQDESQASLSSEVPYEGLSLDVEREDGSSGLLTESSDPLLSCGLPDDIVMKEVLKSDEEFEREFDEDRFCIYHVNTIRASRLPYPPKNEPNLAESEYQSPGFRQPPFSNSPFIPESISSSGIQYDSLPVVQPHNYLAYKLALSTARALHEFSQTGDVRFLLTSMRHLIAVQDEHGDNAIHSSVIHAQEEALRNLVEVARTVADYDILNMHNEMKQTPLHIAVCGKQVNMIQVLLYHGADPNVCDSNGNTPMHLAAQRMASTCLEKLLDTKNYVAKYKSHTPDVDAYNFAGFTALHLAVLAGSETIVRSLCSRGCKVDLLDRTKGRSALHIAVEKNSLPITKFLLEEAGAETDIHMFNGNTPLHLACAQDNIAAISLLVQANADPYLENLEMINREDDSDDESSEEEEFRGLTSLDLAQSNEVRSLLRGEQKLKSLKTAEVKQQVAEILVKGEDKPEKKSSAFDSGIGLSGTNLSCTGDGEEDYGCERAADLLSTETKLQLADSLDLDDKWKRVANILDLEYLINAIENKRSISPTISILGYAKLDKFKAALTKLDFQRELKVLQEGEYLSGTQTSSHVTTKQLEKQVASLSLS